MGMFGVIPWRQQSDLTSSSYSLLWCSLNMNGSIGPFTKRHKLVHNGGFLKSEVLYCSQNIVKSVKLRKTLVTRYSLPIHKISGELKTCDNSWMYLPLWTSLLVAMHDDIENTSICVVTRDR